MNSDASFIDITSQDQAMPPTAPLSRPTISPVTLRTLTQFLEAFVPIKENDVPFYYHLPRLPRQQLAGQQDPKERFMNASDATVNKITFSITPTKGVYDSLHQKSYLASYFKKGLTVAFIHRPFNLDRYRVPRSNGVVLSSHKSLDEVLTTGWNVQLAQRLGVLVERSVCIKGYKDDPERRIGLVGPMQTTEKELCQAIHREFGTWEGCFGFSSEITKDEDVLNDADVKLEAPIKAVASMNAFHPEEIDRVIEAAVQAGFITSSDDCSRILYLTGAVRQLGLEYALTKGIRVVCVGHKTCEDWGIRFLAAQTRAHFAGSEIEVVEVDEPEEPRQYPPAQDGLKKDARGPPASQGQQKPTKRPRPARNLKPVDETGTR